jgi:DNA-binding winged helix-turn-helix (wHTH) protein
MHLRTAVASGPAGVSFIASTVEDVLARELGGACYFFGAFELRTDGTLFAGRRVVPLTPTEESFLRVLVEAGGRRVTKDAIAERVWTRTTVSDSSLSRCVHTLRRKLEAAAPTASPIATCYGRGYRLALAVTRLETDEAVRARTSMARYPHRRPAPIGSGASARAIRPG